MHSASLRRAASCRRRVADIEKPLPSAITQATAGEASASSAAQRRWLLSLASTKSDPPSRPARSSTSG